MERGVRGFTEVQVDYIHNLPSIHLVGYFIMKGDQVKEAGPACQKPMLPGPDHLIVLHVLRISAQDDLLHSLHWH